MRTLCKYLIFAAFLLLLAVALKQGAQAAQVVTTCGTLPQPYTAGSNRDTTVDINGVTCGSGGGGGGGGGAVTAVDGALATEGATTDLACATDNGTCTLDALLKRIAQRLSTLIAGGGSAFSVVDSAAWTAASSPFAPAGGEFNNSAAALTSGQQGTIALGANRHQLVTEDSASAILAAVQGAIPAGSANIGKVGIDQTTPGTTNVVSASVTAALPTNPTATITLPGTTTAYTANQLIANSATAGSVVNPSFAIGNSAGAAIIARVRLSVNDATSTAWGAQTIQVDLWTTTPTWTNGDRGTWSPATQTGAHLGAYTCTMSAEYGDGAYAECAPTVGSYALVKLASGTSVFWSLKAISGSGVTGASKVFTLTPEVQN